MYINCCHKKTILHDCCHKNQAKFQLAIYKKLEREDSGISVETTSLNLAKGYFASAEWANEANVSRSQTA